MKRSVAFAAGIIGIILANQAQAVEPTIISFTAPTTYTDGSAIASGTAISYNVMQAPKGATLVKVATITTTSTTITTGIVPGTEYCFGVTAVIAGQESGPSGTVCKLTPQLVPSAVVITVR